MMPMIELETQVESTIEPHVETVALYENADEKIDLQAAIPVQLCDAKLLEEIKSIPDKMGFKIGDVADLLGVKQYVLRYWETEFDLLRPKKATNNQRFYTKMDVENAFLIRKLLHRDRFSLEGAKMALKDLKAQVKKEKTYTSMVHKIETVHDRMETLILDLQKLKHFFKS